MSACKLGIRMTYCTHLHECGTFSLWVCLPLSGQLTPGRWGGIQRCTPEGRARKKQENETEWPIVDVYTLLAITMHYIPTPHSSSAAFFQSPPSLLTPPILIDLQWSSNVPHFSSLYVLYPHPHPPVLGWTKWHPQLPPQRCQCQLNQKPQKDSFLPAPVRCACLSQQKHGGGSAQPTGHETSRMTAYLILIKSDIDSIHISYSSCWKFLRFSLSGS